MRSVIVSLLIMSIWSSAVWAEGSWNVKGHAFTNTHAWQQGKQVQVSGRVSGGPARSPLQAQIHVKNDAGRTYTTNITINKFTGQGETFETRFTVSRKATWWKITQIDVVGSEPEQMQPKVFIPQITKTSSSAINQNAIALPPSCYPVKQKQSQNMSKVLFSSMRYVCVTIRDKKSNSLVLMKNISPHVLEEIDMPYGKYTATIIGDSYKEQKEFEIANENENIRLY